MIVNTTLRALLEDTPALSNEWKEKLTTWLKIILQDEFPPVFHMQLEMINSMIAIEKEIQETRNTRSELKRRIPKFKQANDFPSIVQTQKEIFELERTIDSLLYQRETICRPKTSVNGILNVCCIPSLALKRMSNAFMKHCRLKVWLVSQQRSRN
jgi:hypothetical protein